MSIIANVSASTFEYNDSSFEDETEDYYAVTAVNSIGESDFSTIINVWIPEIVIDTTSDTTTDDTASDTTSETSDDPGDDTTNDPANFSLFSLLGIILIPVIISRRKR